MTAQLACKSAINQVPCVFLYPAALLQDLVAPVRSCNRRQLHPEGRGEAGGILLARILALPAALPCTAVHRSSTPPHLTPCCIAVTCQAVGYPAALIAKGPGVPFQADGPFMALGPQVRDAATPLRCRLRHGGCGGKFQPGRLGVVMRAGSCQHACPSPGLPHTVLLPSLQVPGYTLMVGKGLFTAGRFNCSGTLRSAVLGFAGVCGAKGFHLDLCC